MDLGLLKNIRLMLLFVSDGWPHLKKESDTKKYIYYIYIYIYQTFIVNKVEFKFRTYHVSYDLTQCIWILIIIYM